MRTRSASYNASALNEFSSELLGQIYNPDDQCEAINGKGSYMCRVSFLNHSKERMDCKCTLLRYDLSVWG